MELKQRMIIVNGYITLNPLIVPYGIETLEKQPQKHRTVFL